LGVGIIHLIERTKLVSGEISVTVCIAVSRGRQHGRNDTGTEECDRKRGDKTVNARRILGKTWDSDKYDSQ
jgi:hypothetical protein